MISSEVEQPVKRCGQPRRVVLRVEDNVPVDVTLHAIRADPVHLLRLVVLIGHRNEYDAPLLAPLHHQVLEPLGNFCGCPHCLCESLEMKRYKFIYRKGVSCFVKEKLRQIYFTYFDSGWRWRWSRQSVSFDVLEI